MNCTQQIGRLTADPDALRTTEDGPVTTFRLAVPRPKGAAKEADFFTVEAWQRLAEVCVQHLARGREVAVDGRLEQREWRSSDDKPRERVVIVARNVRFLRGRLENGAGSPNEASDLDIPF